MISFKLGAFLPKLPVQPVLLKFGNKMVYIATLQKVMGYCNPKIWVKIPATEVTHMVGNYNLSYL